MGFCSASCIFADVYCDVLTITDVVTVPLARRAKVCSWSMVEPSLRCESSSAP